MEHPQRPFKRAPLDREVIGRIAVDYVQMPELSLSVPQAARLWSLDLETCHRLLDQLTRDGFLARRSDDTYARARKY